MSKMKVHHIGIISRSIENSQRIYEMLGYESSSYIVIDNVQHNRILFMRTDDDRQTIELIQPINETSSVYHFKEGYHHICYEVEHPDTFAEDFKKMRIGKIFTKAIQAPAIAGRMVLFACLTNGTFVEFLL